MAYSKLPHRDALATALASVFGDGSLRGEQVTIVHRKRNTFASTFHSEVVTCKIDRKRLVRLFCKYGPNETTVGHGHRGGILYETEVYRRVLHSERDSTLEFFGAYSDSMTDYTWLFLECLGNASRLNKVPAPDAMRNAARWIGRFHSANEGRATTPPRAVLKTYTAEYYRGWVDRTRLFTRGSHGSFPWLPKLCERLDGFFDPLLDEPSTVIHGEYYPRNVLVYRGRTCPVDWESAANGAGEIDLATLTDGWPADVVQDCVQEYQHSRWPEGPPVDFEWRLAVARLYMTFRWLGDRPEWSTGEDGADLIAQLRCGAERVRLV